MPESLLSLASATLCKSRVSLFHAVLRQSSVSLLHVTLRESLVSLLRGLLPGVGLGWAPLLESGGLSWAPLVESSGLSPTPLLESGSAPLVGPRVAAGLAAVFTAGVAAVFTERFAALLFFHIGILAARRPRAPLVVHDVLCCRLAAGFATNSMDRWAALLREAEVRRMVADATVHPPVVDIGFRSWRHVGAARAPTAAHLHRRVALCVAQAGGTASRSVKLAALKVAPSLWRSGWRR